MLLSIKGAWDKIRRIGLGLIMFVGQDIVAIFIIFIIIAIVRGASSRVPTVSDVRKRLSVQIEQALPCVMGRQCTGLLLDLGRKLGSNWTLGTAMRKTGGQEDMRSL